MKIERSIEWKALVTAARALSDNPYAPDIHKKAALAVLQAEEAGDTDAMSADNRNAMLCLADLLVGPTPAPKAP